MCQTAQALNNLSNFITLMIYIFTSEHLNISVRSSNILHLLILVLLIIPFFRIKILNFTDTLYPLFINRGLSPFTLFVNQYSHLMMAEMNNQNMSYY
jgi:hypothetical protein